jgi:cbb3-type cytochrome oxidase cytochrome c subunit
MALCRGGFFALAILFAVAGPALAQGGIKGGPVAPVVAGFERFHCDGQAPVKAGQLLLGELNCVSCHAVEPAWDAVIVRKSAPILDGVGSRVKSAYLRKFLADPHATKPGTAMPDVLAGLPAKEKAQTVEALVHLLASTGAVKNEKPQKKLIGAGRELYHRVGCVACHGTRDAVGNPDKLFTASVPLGDLTAKYSLASLRAFLENPHAVRPSGRMPNLLFGKEPGKEAAEVANYLMQTASADLAAVANMTYAYYEGSWQNLPDFNKLKPVATGIAAGFDLDLARRVNDMAMKFDGFLKIDQDAEYRFHLTSDDGSKLWIDGKLVVANDGIHPPMTTSGSARLTKGVHPFSAAVFNLGGGVELNVDIEGPGLGRQSVSSFVFRAPEGDPGIKQPPNAPDEGPVVVQTALVEKGRGLFASLGCASCHTLNAGQKIASTVKAPALNKLPATGGCLDVNVKPGLPAYGLSALQRSAIANAIQAPPKPPDAAPEQTIARTMTAFNCYACHERQKIGGVTEALNPYFTTAQQEMGDEGRLPPTLTGAGAKLNGEYLRRILDKGSHDRPYMITRMPAFGNANVGELVALFENADAGIAAPQVSLDLPPAKLKNDARKLVGDGALACIKCHTFAGHKAEGVQGIDMALMTQRLRKGWFHRYMIDPNKYRPGTRMPSAFPGGQTLLPKYLGGTAEQQIEGIWVYLADGAKAALPPGTKKQLIPLVPGKEAIIYRNFIEGAGPRAIGVGYPELAHLAFDANNLRLAMIWQGAFIDASRHWTDRGAGFEPPAGDNVLHLPNAVAFAVLEKPDQPWPTKSARDLPDYHFNGYRVTKDERPTFLYTIHGVKVEDFPNAIATDAAPIIRRTLNFSAAAVPEHMYFRAAVASKIVELKDGWFQINEWKMRIESTAAPQIRQSGGQFELLVPVRLKDGQAKIVQEFHW